jgi:hypothetical protein
MSLIPVQRAIGLKLVLEDPLVGDDIALGGQGTKSHVLLDCRASYSSSIAQR